MGDNSAIKYPPGDYRLKPFGKSVDTKFAQKTLKKSPISISRYILKGAIRARKGGRGYELSYNDVMYLKEHPLETGRPRGPRSKSSLSLVNGSTTVTLSVASYKKLQVIAISNEKSMEENLEMMIDESFQAAEKKVRNL